MDSPNNYISSAIIVSIIFIILNILESKTITKEKLQLKKILRHVILVFLSVMGGLYLVSLIKETNNTRTNVFINNPEF